MLHSLGIKTQREISYLCEAISILIENYLKSERGMSYFRTLFSLSLSSFKI